MSHSGCKLVLIMSCFDDITSTTCSQIRVILDTSQSFFCNDLMMLQITSTTCIWIQVNLDTSQFGYKSLICPVQERLPVLELYSNLCSSMITCYELNSGIHLVFFFTCVISLVLLEISVFTVLLYVVLLMGLCSIGVMFISILGYFKFILLTRQARRIRN